MYQEFKTTFVRVAPKVPGVLYEPAEKSEKSSICVIAIHCESDFLDHSIGAGLAKRGYTVLCANTHDAEDSFASKIKDVDSAMRFVRALPGIKKVVIMGHSGGATLMTAYQSVAENGGDVFRKASMLFPIPEYVDNFIPADGFLSLDSNWGNGTMRLFSTDPAIIDENSGIKVNPELDMFNPANGWSASGAHYSEAFMQKFFEAQHERNTRLIKHALDRMALINAGKGFYLDDEPMMIPGAALFGFNNKVFPQDIRYLSRTKEEQTLVHNGGRLTKEIVHTVRKPRHLESVTPDYTRGAMKTTVKKFLDSWAVRTASDYHYNNCEVFGVLYDSAYTCAPGNIRHISVPTLILGMTANWEFTAVETLYNNCGSKDKSCAYIEGADHDFHTFPAGESFPGEFGDTTETTYDYVDKWLSASGRFI